MQALALVLPVRGVQRSRWYATRRSLCMVLAGTMAPHHHGQEVRGAVAVVPELPLLHDAASYVHLAIEVRRHRVREVAPHSCTKSSWVEVEVLTDVLVAVSTPTRQQASRVIRTPRWSTWRTPSARILVITGLLLLATKLMHHFALPSSRPVPLCSSSIFSASHPIRITPSRRRGSSR